VREGQAVIIPVTRAEVAAVARALLDLADTPADVRTQRGGTEFLVPEALADKYRKYMNRRGRAKKEGTNG
jgi:hypothetical protein